MKIPFDMTICKRSVQTVSSSQSLRCPILSPTANIGKTQQLRVWFEKNAFLGPPVE